MPQSSPRRYLLYESSTEARNPGSSNHRFRSWLASRSRSNLSRYAFLKLLNKELESHTKVPYCFPDARTVLTSFSTTPPQSTPVRVRRNTTGNLHDRALTSISSSSPSHFLITAFAPENPQLSPPAARVAIAVFADKLKLLRTQGPPHPEFSQVPRISFGSDGPPSWATT
jgi:hypothetical protein